MLRNQVSGTPDGVSEHAQEPPADLSERPSDTPPALQVVLDMFAPFGLEAAAFLSTTDSTSKVMS